MDVHIVKEIIWKKRLEELDEDPNYTYFEKQYGQIFPRNVCFYHSAHALKVCDNKRCTLHLGLVVVVLSQGSPIKSHI